MNANPRAHPLQTLTAEERIEQRGQWRAERRVESGERRDGREGRVREKRGVPCKRRGREGRGGRGKGRVRYVSDVSVPASGSASPATSKRHAAFSFLQGSLSLLQGLLFLTPGLPSLIPGLPFPYMGPGVGGAVRWGPCGQGGVPVLERRAGAKRPGPALPLIRSLA